MTSFLLASWRLEAPFALGFAAAVWSLFAARRSRPAALLFAAGLALWVLAEASPLDAAGGEALLSAHMVQHILLSQVIPPLLLLGTPAVAARRALRHPAAYRAELTMRRPELAWLVGVGTLWLWHYPPLYAWAAGGEVSRSLAHLTVLAAGVVFWWPVFSPLEGSRMAPLAAVPYLAGACLASTVLGMLLTFAPEVLYGGYLSGESLPQVRLLCEQIGLTPQVDQQIAGLLMWVPCCLLYLSTVGFTLTRWLGVSPAGAGGER